jgi:hypothetical protein
MTGGAAGLWRSLAAVGQDPAPGQLEPVARYNQYAEKGEDPDWADPEQIRVLTGPDNVNIKPIAGPPYGAIQQWPGTLGTNGGLRIDENARVLGNHTRSSTACMRRGTPPPRSSAPPTRAAAPAWARAWSPAFGAAATWAPRPPRHRLIAEISQDS